jgi:hypothetical protein
MEDFPDATPTDEVGGQVAALAAQAVALLQERAAGRLDYSPASLEAVDDILAEAAGYAAELPESSVVGLMQQLGCYVLEVARRRYGGTYYWHEEGEQPVLVVGEPQAHVGLMAWSKAMGRLAGDAGDNLAFLFAGFAARAAAPVAGDEVVFA